jgi:hypothetical protein
MNDIAEHTSNVLSEDPRGPDAGNPPGRTNPPVQATEDRIAYRIAVGSIGLALVAYLIGAAIIAAGGKPVPTQYWTAGAGLAGALLGILAPTPTPAKTRKTRPESDAWIKKLGTGIANVARDLWNNRGLLILMVVFGLSLGFAIANNSSQLEAVAAAAGGALVGLLAPPPTPRQ